MRYWRYFLLPLITAFAFSNATKAANDWQPWSSTRSAPVVLTVTEKSLETQYLTQTMYITVEGPTIIETEYIPTTQYQTVTQVTSFTVTEAPKTITQINFVKVTEVPETITQTNTVTQTSTVPTTVVSVSTISVTVTSLLIESTTVVFQSTATIVNTVSQQVTITSLNAVTQYVSMSTTCPTPTSGITTCPTRIINPTYTPAEPLPSNYLWGCPPGKLCHPKRENCNFEQNLPADTYVCSPDECLPVAELPPLRTFEENEANINDSCAFITPIDDYFNLNPLLFGLDFDIFNIYGQSKCTTALPVTISTVTAACAQAARTWSAWSSPTTTAGWGKWRASTTGPSASRVTKRAELGDRIIGKRQNIEVPKSCYEVCNQAMVVWQSIGKENNGCDKFESAFDLVTSCTDKYNYVSVTSLVTSMTEPIKQCLNNVIKREADEWLRDVLTGGFRFARN